LGKFKPARKAFVSDDSECDEEAMQDYMEVKMYGTAVQCMVHAPHQQSTT
jgi:hypothetical protein